MGCTYIYIQHRIPQAYPILSVLLQKHHLDVAEPRNLQALLADLQRTLAEAKRKAKKDLPMALWGTPDSSSHGSAYLREKTLSIFWGVSPY